MERLTEWSYLAGVMTGDLKAGVDERKAFDRLATYEDFLERWKLKDLEEAGRIFRRVNALGGTDLMAQYRDLGPIDHLRELAQAEKDGRLIVLPCKVGDTVYRVITTRDNDPIITEIEIKTLGQVADLIGKIGKKQVFVSWYLTREEAEAALKKREEADNVKRMIREAPPSLDRPMTR